MLNTLEEEPRLEEAYENLRIIREMMERSTKHSSLSGVAGLLIGVWAITGVLLTRYVAYSSSALVLEPGHIVILGSIWSAVLCLSVFTDYVMNKRAAAAVGKFVFSSLGTRIVQSAAPGFTAGLALTIYLIAHGGISHIWGYWMLCYGIAICSVGLFSVKPVSFLGWSFMVAGAITLFLTPLSGLWMMAITFGGFHICYGLFTGASRGEW